MPNRIKPLPETRETPNIQPGRPKLLLTPEDVAYALSISRASVYQLLAAREIPSLSIGRSRRIPLSWLEDWIARKIEQTA
jgi:excisionase family DNA binding protein